MDTIENSHLVSRFSRKNIRSVSICICSVQHVRRYKCSKAAKCISLYQIHPSLQVGKYLLHIDTNQISLLESIIGRLGLLVTLNSIMDIGENYHYTDFINL